MKKTALLTLALVSLLLSACVAPPTEQERKSAHYGRSPANYRVAVNHLVRERQTQFGEPLRVISVGKPQKDWMREGNGHVWGYSVVVAYQPAGIREGSPFRISREKIFFRNGRQVAVLDASNLGDAMLSAVANSLTASLQQQQSGDGDDSGGDDDASPDTSAKKRTRRK